MSPIELFNKWYNEELNLTTVKIPSACCLSTIGIDGFPNARFVSLKEVTSNHFIITGPTTSRKGIEINSNNKVALTFWWTETERQVRIQGTATKISEKLADKYFAERNRESQIVSIISNQGKEIKNIDMLIQKYSEAEKQFFNIKLKRPEDWGGYLIEPLRIEFLEFKPNRFHERKLYEFSNRNWSLKQLQP